MQYISTRGREEPKKFSEIVLEGLAGDGGLYVPQEYPKLTREDLHAMRQMTYADVAFEVLKHFADDIEPADLKRLIDETYTAQTYCNVRAGSDPKAIVPVRKLKNGLFLAELSNGPTLAFKDMAMQFLGALFSYLLAREGKVLNILGATSGDTGSAAEYAMRSRKGIRVFMLSPYGRMSEFQRAQMYSLSDANIFNLAVQGVFDDCQDIVKEIGRDAAFKARYSIGTINSINWARVAAQVVYYVYSYLKVTENEDEAVDVAVPTGNFGNVLAAWIAKQMGVPFARLAVATNENDVLDEFFKTGVYRIRDGAHTYLTSSPSMDISKASNFERYIYDILGRNSLRLCALKDELDRTGRFSVSGADFESVRESGFTSGKSVHADRLSTIRAILKTEGILIDPHTADAVKVALDRMRGGVKMLVMETAQPAKFAATIREATGKDPERPVGYVDIEKRPQHVTVVPAQAQVVRDFLVDKLSH